MSNLHLHQEPVLRGAPAGSARTIVYAVHGRGQSPAFMAEVADRVDLDGIAWILPAAHGGSWYPQSFLAPPEENQPWLDEALDTVRMHLERFARPDADLVVLGFSQGACLLSEFLLREQPELDGAILHTGGYAGPEERAWPALDGGGLSGLRVDMFSSRQDAWVPLTRVQATAQALRALGCRVQLNVYDDTEHHLNADSIAAIRVRLQPGP